MAWKGIKVIAIAVLVTIILWSTHLSRRTWTAHSPPEPFVEPPRYEVWGLRDLSEVIQISTISVEPNFHQAALPTKLDSDLTVSFTDVNLTEPLPEWQTKTRQMIAQKHQVPDASHLLIGLATKTNRLRDSLPAIAQWATGTGVRFVVLVGPPQPGEATVGEIQQLYADHNISMTLIESTLPWYDQYVSLLAVLYDHATPHTKWAATMDDDTYFFSLGRVLAMLDKYDSSEPYYIGGLSENKDTMDRLGYLAYGGAGIFYSMPLLKQLRPYRDDCIALPDDAGDLRIAHCITTYSTTKFTWEHYLFQMDLHGDVTGFYEAARTRPVSTHHWHSWHFHDMAKVGAVGRVCGNECVLQKYTTSDGWMLTNGFSIVKYSYSREEEARYIEGAMEHTWADTIWVKPTSWNYTLAPLRPKDPGKIQYLIEKVDEDDRTMTLYYVRRKNGIGQGIVRMIWGKSL